MTDGNQTDSNAGNEAPSPASGQIAPAAEGTAQGTPSVSPAPCLPIPPEGDRPSVFVRTMVPLERQPQREDEGS